MLALCRVLSPREIWRHPGRSVLIAASIALGVIAWTSTGLLNRALDESLRQAATPTALADLHVSNGDSGLPRHLVGRVAAVPGVRAARPVVVERIFIVGQHPSSAILLGVDLPAYRHDTKCGVTTSPSTSARFLKAKLQGATPVVVGSSLWRRIEPDGETLTAKVGGKTRTLTLAGTFEATGSLGSLANSVILTGDREAAALAGHPGQISRMDVEIDPGVELRAVRERIERAIGNAGEVLSPQSHDGRIRESLSALRAGFVLCGYGALALALFLITTVVSVSVAERQRTIGLLRALGSTSGQIRAEVLGEALFLGTIGSLTGVALGFAAARVALGSLLRAVGDVFVPLQSAGVSFEPAFAIGGMASGIATCLLAAWLPAARASALTPVQAMRGTGAGSGPGMGIRAMAAAMLVASALGVFFGRRFLGDSVTVLVVFALGLVTAVMAIPLATGVLARLLRPIAERTLGISGRLALESLIGHPARTGSTIAGLTCAVAFMLQTGGVIQGNESAVRSWVDDCITGDLFVTSGGPMSASGRTLPMDESLAKNLVETLPGAKVVPMRFRHLDWSCQGERTRILLLALDAKSYVDLSSDRVPPLTDLPLYQRLLEPETALVSENFAALNGLRVGSMITLAGREGPVKLKVVGTVVDFSNSRGTILVDRRGAGRAFTTSEVDLFAVGLKRSIDPEAARAAVSQTGWAVENSVESMTRGMLRAHILGMIRRLYGVAYAQEIVAAAVAALGVSASMLIGIVQRRRELGLLRALGATSRQVFVSVIAEAAAMAVIGAALGVVLGLGLQWYVLRILLIKETGFAFPVLLPWADALMVCAVVGVAAIISGLAPAISAARMGIGMGLARD